MRAGDVLRLVGRRLRRRVGVLAGDIGQPARARQGQLAGIGVAQSTVQPEVGQRHAHRVRISGGQVIVVDAQSLGAAGSQPADHHAGRAQQRCQQLASALGPQVEHDRALAGVEGKEERTGIEVRPPGGERADCARRITVTRALDLDDVGTPVGEQPGAERRGDSTSDLDDTDPVQWRDPCLPHGTCTSASPTVVRSPSDARSTHTSQTPCRGALSESTPVTNPRHTRDSPANTGRRLR